MSEKVFVFHFFEINIFLRLRSGSGRKTPVVGIPFLHYEIIGMKRMVSFHRNFFPDEFFRVLQINEIQTVYERNRFSFCAGSSCSSDSVNRSEERRVGKECRARWSRDQCTNNVEEPRAK